MMEAALAEHPGLDTREGSVLWYGQAPAAAEAQNLYLQLDTVLRETFGDTASRPYLIQRARERGMEPRPATRAVFRGEFTPADAALPQGARFRQGDFLFTLGEPLGEGAFRLVCETAGSAGNSAAGALSPVEYVPGLTEARLAGLLVPGEDEEGTEEFRSRYLESFQAQAFGGNRADYQEKTGALPGVGGVRVYRAWNGGLSPEDFLPPAEWEGWRSALPEDTPQPVLDWLDKTALAAGEGLLTTGGAVRLVILDSTFRQPSQELVAQVQQAVDPDGEHGEGAGFAPMGHFVTVAGVREIPVDVEAGLVFEEGWGWDECRSYLEEAVDGCLEELRRGWAGAQGGLTVRRSVVESRLLACPGVLDVTFARLNGGEGNLLLGEEEIPVRGAVYGS